MGSATIAAKAALEARRLGVDPPLAVGRPALGLETTTAAKHSRIRDPYSGRKDSHHLRSDRAIKDPPLAAASARGTAGPASLVAVIKATIGKVATKDMASRGQPLVWALAPRRLDRAIDRLEREGSKWTLRSLW